MGQFEHAIESIPAFNSFGSSAVEILDCHTAEMLMWNEQLLESKEVEAEAQREQKEGIIAFTGLQQRANKEMFYSYGICSIYNKPPIIRRVSIPTSVSLNAEFHQSVATSLNKRRSQLICCRFRLKFIHISKNGLRGN